MNLPNRAQFNQSMQNLKMFLKENEKTILEGINYKLFTSGGIVLDFNLTINSLISLLHIDIECLKEFDFITTENPIEQLNEMIDNSDIIYDLIEYRSITYSLIFDFELIAKINSLPSILKMKIERIEFASNYSLARAAINNEGNIIDDVDYYVAIRNIDNFIFLELKRNESTVFKPVGMKVSTSLEEKADIFKCIISEQRVMTISGMQCQNGKIDNNSLSEMYFKTEKLLDIAKKYRAELCLTKDYFFSIRKTKRLEEKIADNNYIIKFLTEAIINQTSFDLAILDKFEFNETIRVLINAYNKMMSEKSNNSQKLIKK